MIPSHLFSKAITPISYCLGFGRQTLGVISHSCCAAKNAASQACLMPVASVQAPCAFPDCLGSRRQTLGLVLVFSEAEFLQLARFVAPIFLHFDPKFQEHFRTEQHFNIMPRLRSDFF